MTKRGALVAAVAACLVTSCADLHVQRLSDANDQGLPPLKGNFTYYLPQTALNLTLSVTATQCGLISSDPEPAKPLTKDGIAFKVTATASAVSQPDRAYGYRIDYAKAESWMKEINFTLNTNANRTLQSFNGQINDQTGPIIVAAITTAIQIAGAVVIPKPPALGPAISEEKGKPPPAPTVDASTYCSKAVLDALKKVRDQTKEVNSLKARIARYNQSLSGNQMPGRIDPTTAWSAAVTAVQSDITATTKKLTVSITRQWIPAYGTDNFALSPNAAVDVAHLQLPIDKLVPKLLSDDAGKPWYANEKYNDPLDGAWVKAHGPFIFVLAVDKATFFDKAAYDSANKDPIENRDDPGGLLIRDPALGIVQRCKIPDNALTKLTQSDEGWLFAAGDVARLCAPPSLITTDASADSDDSTRISVTLPQLGRPLIFGIHSALFENNSLGVTLASDGTIQSVSNHDVSTAAAGLNSLSTAASAAAQAETARNNGITAANTATLNRIQLPDTIKKALADCLQQSAAIVKAGGTPVGTCQ